MQEVNVDHWMKSEAHDIEVSLQIFSSGPFTPTSSFLYSKFDPNSPFQASICTCGSPCQNFKKKHIKFQFKIDSDSCHLKHFKKQPFTPQKSNTKHHKMFVLDQKQKTKRTTII